MTFKQWCAEIWPRLKAKGFKHRAKAYSRWQAEAFEKFIKRHNEKVDKEVQG